MSGNFIPTEMERFLKVVNNTAPMAADISYGAWLIEVVDNGNAEELITSDGQDGVLTMVLNVSGPHGLPSDDQVMYDVYNADNKVLSQSTRAWGVGDHLKNVSIGFKREPGTYYLEFYSENSPDVPVVREEVNVVPCPGGHVTGGRNDTCNPCPRGLFSFSPADAECTICPNNANCPGLDKVWPLHGWWHSTPQSTNILRCFNRDACRGGESAAVASGTATTSARSSKSAADRTQTRAHYTSMQCAPGYEGNLCGECGQGYGKTRPFFCRKCMPAAAIVMLYLLGAVSVVAVVKLLVYFQLSDMGERTGLSTPIPSELLRAVVIHCQWLYIPGSMVGVPWPPSLLVPIQIIGGMWSSTSGSSIGVECILNHRKGLPVAIQKLLLCLFTPAGVLCAVLMIEVAMHHLQMKKSGRKQRIGHDFASVVMCIVFMFLPIWVSTAMSLFTCVPLDDPVQAPNQAAASGSFWVEDMSQKCYTGYHRGWAIWLGIPLILLFCLALPAGVFVFMWYSRKQGKLGNSSFQKHYGFMFRLWRAEVCWWESVVLLQTVALVMAATFGFAMGPYYQALVSAAVLVLVAILLLVVRPFKCSAANKVAVLSACVLYLTVYVALTFLPYNSVGPGPVYGNIMGVVILLANLAFLIRTTWQLMQVVDWKIVGTVVSSVGDRCFKGSSGRKGTTGVMPA